MPRRTRHNAARNRHKDQSWRAGRARDHREIKRKEYPMPEDTRGVLSAELPPNFSIERKSNGLRPLAASQVKRRSKGESRCCMYGQLSVKHC